MGVLCLFLVACFGGPGLDDLVGLMCCISFECFAERFGVLRFCGF